MPAPAAPPEAIEARQTSTGSLSAATYELGEPVRDRLTTPAAAREYEQAIVDARLVLLPGTEHVPMVERPHEVAATLVVFLHGAKSGVPAETREPFGGRATG